MNKRVTATLRKSHQKGGWSSFMALGDGTHMLPVKAEVRKAIGKEAGESVTVQILKRINP